MTKTLALLLAAASILLCLTSAARAELRAGAAAVDITPEQWPIFLRGSFFKKPASSAHDPLHARAIVLDDGDNTKLAFVVIDSCMVSRENLDRAKALASESTGIPVDRMLTSATHTHSAPHDYPRYGTDPEIAYQEKLVSGIAQSVIDASEALQPAEIGFASSDEPGEVFNRRWHLEPGTMPVNPFGSDQDEVKMNPGSGPQLLRPAGPTDPEVYVLSVRTARGRPLALLANYSLHYVGGPPAEQVSADYFGEFARLVGVRLAPDKPEPGFVGILSNGTSGDINNINFKNPRPRREAFEQIRLVASKIADAAYYAYREIEHRRDLPLAMLEEEVVLNRRVPSEQEIARARLTLKLVKEKGETDLPKHAATYAERTLELAAMDPRLGVKIQVVRIGDLAINSLPFETFAEIGLTLKEESPFAHSFTIELANGGEGYLPTPAQHRLGGYETWLGTNRVQLDASDILTTRLLEMQAELQR